MKQSKNMSSSQLSHEELLTQLLNLSKQMSEVRNLEPLLDLIIGNMLTLVNAERGYVVVHRPNNQLEFKSSQGKYGIEVYNDVDQISHSILEHVYELGQPLLIKNATLDPRFSHASSVLNLRLRSVMCVPLITKQGPVGAFYVENRSESGIFSNRELDLLVFFSHHAAVAIENANLNDNLEEVVQERTQQLVEAKDVAENASKAKSDFLAYVSHELRSPLTAILNYSEMLQREYYGAINVRQGKTVQSILKSVAHILSLVNDLLDLNKIEAGLLDIQLADIDLSLVLQEIVPNIESLLFEKPVQFKLDIQESLPLIKGDKKRIYQIFLNLLSNAAKFTYEGYIQVDVSFDNSFVNVQIEDTGIGIPEDEHGLVFQLYKQSRKNPLNVIGSGLGLPISKRLIDLHGGEITLISKQGQGSTFTASLPIG